MFTASFMLVVVLACLFLGGLVVSAADDIQPPPPKVIRAGVASWYGSEVAGRRMANGHVFWPHQMTCASWDYPLGTHLLVRHGKAAVIVEVTDHGPAKRLNRALDLSSVAFKKLAPLEIGLINVTYSEL